MKKSSASFLLASIIIIFSAFLLSKDQGKNKANILLNDGETVQLDSIFNKFSENSIIENLEKTSANLFLSSKHQRKSGGKVKTTTNGPFANNPKPNAIKKR